MATEHIHTKLYESLIIQVTCNNCGSVTASQQVTKTNPESRGHGGDMTSDGLPFTLDTCCLASANPCVTLTVMTLDEWKSVRSSEEPAVFNGRMVQAAKDLLDYAGRTSFKLS